MHVPQAACRAISQQEAYHTTFPAHVLNDNRPICHLEALSVVVAVKYWALHWKGHVVHLYSDNATVLTIFQAGRGRDSFIEVCARELWLACVQFSITLGVAHTETADALSCTKTMSIV